MGNFSQPHICRITGFLKIVSYYMDDGFQVFNIWKIESIQANKKNNEEENVDANAT